MDPISCIAASIGIANTAIKTLKKVYDYSQEYKDIRLSVSSFRSQLVITEQTLVQIDELVKAKLEADNITRPVMNALDTGVSACHDILHDIDRFANEEAAKTVLGKVVQLWNLSSAQSKKQDLHIQIQSLSALVTVLQAQSLQDQRGQLGRLFGTLGRAKKAAANVKRVDSVLDGDKNSDPPPYSPIPTSPTSPALSTWGSPSQSRRSSQFSAPKPTRSWSSTVLLSGDAKRQLSRKLIDAAADGNLKLVDELWNKGGDVNYQSQSEEAKKSRMTAVHATVWEGHFHILKFLVERGAKLDKVMEGGLTALHIATCQDYPDIVQFLLSNGADANAADTVGETALFGVSDEITRLLLGAKANVNHRNNALATPLHQAAYIGYPKVVQDLVASGAEIEYKDKYGKTPLHIACDCAEDPYVQDRMVIVSTLLKAGASPNIPARETGATALHQAVQNGHLELVDLLLSSSAGVNARTAKGYTPLHLATNIDSPAIAQRLIKSGADIYAHTIEKKHTPLHCAAINNQPQCVKALVQAGANIEARCYKGFTALHYAAEGISLETVEILLAAKANPFAKDLNNQTPLHCARELPEVVGQLVAAMASVEARDARDATPLHTVAQYGSLATVQALLDHSAPADVINSKKQTPLEALCSNETLWLIEAVEEPSETEKKEEVAVSEQWESDVQSPWEIRLDVLKLLLEEEVKISKECVKSVTAWQADHPKATVLATLCLKTSGMTRLMILSNRAVIASGVLTLIRDLEAAVEKKAAEMKEEKESKKGMFGRKKDDKKKDDKKSKEKDKGKTDSELKKKK